MGVTTMAQSSGLYAGRARAEVIELVRRIQTLTLELRAPERRESGPQLEARKRELEQLRWRLAVAARRAAADDCGAAA
jgi:hypothetical protein